MKKIVKELAEQAGFVFWTNEEWKPKGATVDWSLNYDKELERFFELAVEHAKLERFFKLAVEHAKEEK